VEYPDSWPVDLRILRTKGQGNVDFKGYLRTHFVQVKCGDKAECGARDPSHNGYHVWTRRHRQRGQVIDSAAQTLKEPVVPHPVESPRLYSSAQRLRGPHYTPVALEEACCFC